MNNEWNITVNNTPYHLELNLKKNKLSINSDESISLSKFKRKTHIMEYEYQIPLEDQIVVLHISNKKGQPSCLTINNRDCMTGEEYEIEKVPAWSWLFAALYLINFIFIIGGAIGGAIMGGFGFTSMRIAANKEHSILFRVLVCTGMYILVTVASLVLATFIFSIFYA